MSRGFVRDVLDRVHCRGHAPGRCNFHTVFSSIQMHFLETGDTNTHNALTVADRPTVVTVSNVVRAE
jgi:hypothetical protein